MPNLSQRRIAVVGGGLAGLEFAVAATKAGGKCELFEVGPQTRTRHVDWDSSRHFGDEKTQTWASEDWGLGGGLSERLGGRSLCYHGVMLGLEPSALADWGSDWTARLVGARGLYATILNELLVDYPELNSQDWPPHLENLGIQFVPQAARFEIGGGFEAYSPLDQTLDLAASGLIKLNRGRVTAVTPDRRGWAVEVNSSNQIQRHGGFDLCVLAASAIGNVQIMAASLGRDITTSITDHFSAGIFVRLPPGNGITPFRHRMLWSGYVPAPEKGMNIFFLERPRSPSGDRIVQIQAVIERTAGHGELSVNLQADGSTSRIRSNISHDDLATMDSAHNALIEWAKRLATVRVAEVTRDDRSASSSKQMQDRTRAQWSGHDEALEIIMSKAQPGDFTRYAVAYGSFEHEACTHPLGRTGNLAVTPDLEVVELPNVYVLGPGVFPRLGAANPALTILALSRWLAGQLCD